VSILNSTKQILGLAADYTAFDLDVLTHINAAFSVTNQLGLGPEEGVFITGATEDWPELGLPDNQLNMMKTYVYLKVRSLFDPPTTSFALAAMDNQIKEHEWRLNMLREAALPPVVIP